MWQATRKATELIRLVTYIVRMRMHTVLINHAQIHTHTHTHTHTK